LPELARHCAFLTLEERGDFVVDDELAVGPLTDLGWKVSTVPWRQSAIPWRAFDAVIIRSTWDYWNDVPAFLERLAEIDRQTRLANALELVRWNLSKAYLRDLDGKGVATVPTLWLDGLEQASPMKLAEHLGTEEFVVKPLVGANGEDAFRFACSGDPARWTDITARYPGRPCMVQPFMPNVLSEGEYSLFFFKSEYSHAVLKTPAPGEFRSQEERGAEIRPVRAETELLSSGRRALTAVSPTPLYARVDLVRNTAGGFAVMELELIEPSLYLRMDPGAPQRFARAIDQWFGGS